MSHFKEVLYSQAYPVAFCIGAIIGAYIFFGVADFLPTLIANCVSAGIAIVLLLVLALMMWKIGLD